jgi:glucose/arabinose dehydrogenase
MRRLLVCLAGALVMLAGDVWTQGPAIQKLPVGAGAIGKGPDALTPPGYEDVPRPPAFNDAVRKENARIIQLVDNYTPQPAFAGQTRAPRPTKIAAYDVQTFAEGLFSPWSFAFLPDGRVLVSETNKGLRLLSKEGKPIRYIEGLPIDFTKRAQQLLDIVPDKDFARARCSSSTAFRPRKPATSARVRRTRRSTTRRSKWWGAGSCRPMRRG